MCSPPADDVRLDAEKEAVLEYLVRWGRWRSMCLERPPRVRCDEADSWATRDALLEDVSSRQKARLRRWMAAAEARATADGLPAVLPFTLRDALVARSWDGTRGRW